MTHSSPACGGSAPWEAARPTRGHGGRLRQAGGASASRNRPTAPRPASGGPPPSPLDAAWRRPQSALPPQGGRRARSCVAAKGLHPPPRPAPYALRTTHYAARYPQHRAPQNPNPFKAPKRCPRHAPTPCRLPKIANPTANPAQEPPSPYTPHIAPTATPASRPGLPTSSGSPPWSRKPGSGRVRGAVWRAARERACGTACGRGTTPRTSPGKCGTACGRGPRARSGSSALATRSPPRAASPRASSPMPARPEPTFAQSKPAQSTPAQSKPAQCTATFRTSLMARAECTGLGGMKSGGAWCDRARPSDEGPTWLTPHSA